MSEFEFYREDDGTLTLESAINQALGAASMCWETLSNAGVFQSERAEEIGRALLDAIRTGEVDEYEDYRDYDDDDDEFYDPNYCEQCNDYHDFDETEAIYDDGVDDED